MGSNTEELDLYKADPIADGNDTFNIDRMLNENWEKVDDGVKANRLAANAAQATANQALGAIGGINASTPEQVAAVGAKVDAVSSKVTAVDGKVTTVGTKIDTANTGITGIKADVANLDGDVAAIGTKVGAVDSKVVAVDGKVAAVGTKVDTANTAITGVSGKIGNSTDGETAATLFGRMLGIRNVVDWIKNTWTATKAGLLDVAVSTRAPASTALSTATWTSTRATKLDNLDGKISEVGKSLSKKLVPSNNVKKTFGNLVLTFPYASHDKYCLGILVNTNLNISGAVRIKIFFRLETGTPVNIRMFNPYFYQYSIGSTGGRGSNIFSVNSVFKPVGTEFELRDSNDVGSNMSIGQGQIASGSGERSFSAEAMSFSDVPLVVLAERGGYGYTPGSLIISKIEICYDEVSI